MSILRETTIDRLASHRPSFTSTRGFRVPLYGLGAVALLAVSFENEAVIKALLGGCFVIMALLWALAVGEPSISGGVHVRTSSGAISAPSHRKAGIYAAVLLVVSAIPLTLYAWMAAAEGLSRRLSYNLSAALALVGVGYALWRLIAALRSVDLLFDARALTAAAPLFPRRALEWDAIASVVGDRKRLTLTLSSGDTLVLDTRLQRTDHTVLVELINRCAQHPVARGRIGDVILGDLLLDAAPDGTEPPGPERSAPAHD
ncbi:hypothetical protein [Microbacterium sp. UFMG61]|uniref:hypothetical protein n=1 Tax=Microbacterium sp. UFMG61 TaxID=2745935 RepID=UPI00188E6055|nr:hypothetical protein [Microbacterium sp. UFMG61]